MNSYEQSARLLERAKKSLAGGVSSEFRKYNHPHAIFYSHANGSRIMDVDGNEYLDFTLSQGPMLVGHNHPHVVKRVEDYARKGQLYAGQHMLEIELAEKLQQWIPSAELMRFCLDGSEAVQTAFRLARAKTGKKKFLRFEGHYHGWLDNVAWGLSTPSAEELGAREEPVVFPWTQGLPENVQHEFIILPWNDLALLEKTIKEKHAEIAAIITEPIMCNNGCICHDRVTYRACGIFAMSLISPSFLMKLLRVSEHRWVEHRNIIRSLPTYPFLPKPLPVAIRFLPS